MSALIRKITGQTRTAIRWVLAWANCSFEGVHRFVLMGILVVSFSLALVTWFALLAFVPIAYIFLTKSWYVAQRIYALNYVEVQEQNAGDIFCTKNDRQQRAWVLLGVSLVIMMAIFLTGRAAFIVLPEHAVPSELLTYLVFAAVLTGGFLLFYLMALRFNKTVWRTLASVTVTLPAFFIVVAALSLVLAWLANILKTIGLSPDVMISDGFTLLYNVQRILGDATDLFLQLDPLIIGASVVFAVLLLLFYTFTIPYYWIKGTTYIFDVIYFIAILFSGAAIIFASGWIGDVQTWLAETQYQDFAQGIDSQIIDQQAASLSNYQSNELESLVKALVLPYTAGVIVARFVLMWRMSVAKRKCDEVLNEIASAAELEEKRLSEFEKIYFYYDGNRTLWLIVMRSIGKQVALPQPFIPRKLSFKERITGNLNDRVDVE